MERLTIKTKDGYERQSIRTKNQQLIDKLADYEDLEEQGRLVKLPCKVGDIVFYISGKIILEYEVVGFSVDGTGAWLIYGEHHVDENDKTYSYNFEVDKFGKTVFLTKSEAEAKLKELRCNND